jgi:hypothetical protein
MSWATLTRIGWRRGTASAQSPQARDRDISQIHGGKLESRDQAVVLEPKRRVKKHGGLPVEYNLHREVIPHDHLQQVNSHEHPYNS